MGDSSRLIRRLAAALAVFALALLPLAGFANATPSGGLLSDTATPHDITPAAETIVVTSTTDPDTSDSTTCATTPCTLRRAIVQARNSSNKPVTIEFDLPTSDPGYDETNDVWVFDYSSTIKDLRRINGQITIDGTTQSDNTRARPLSDGPSVFIRGTVGSNLFNEIVFDGDENAVRGVGLQYITLTFNGSDNTIEDNWLGLDLTGTSIAFPGDNPANDNDATISTSNNQSGNTIQNNTIAGSRSDAINLSDNNSLVTDNQIGTRADGTIPTVAEDIICRPNAPTNNWFGGDGINVSGEGNTVSNNVLVGMLTASADPNTTAPAAIEVAGSDHTIENNQIGIDADDTKHWVCNIGIRLTDAGHDVLDNQIYGASAEGAIAIFGTEISLSPGAITLQGNTIEESSAAITFGPLVPNRYANFNPAEITSVSGTTVTGTNGPNGLDGQTPFPSACNGCTIEVFLDDSDGNVEALQSLGTTTSDATTGEWTLEIPSALSEGQGLRTISTTSAFDQIQNYSADTSTGVSVLYGASYEVYVPLVIK
jgi:hypothetical protein